MIFTEFSESGVNPKMVWLPGIPNPTGNMYITSGSNKNHISITSFSKVSIAIHPSQ